MYASLHVYIYIYIDNIAHYMMDMYIYLYMQIILHYMTYIYIYIDMYCMYIYWFKVFTGRCHRPKGTIMGGAFTRWDIRYRAKPFINDTR